LSYSVFTGEQKSLVFPIMCNAFATIGYSDNIVDSGVSSDTTDDITYGIWGHTGDFTFEAVVTPYDINGYGSISGSGHGLVPTGGSLTASANNTLSNSKKIMSALNEDIFTAGTQAQWQNQLYLSNTARLTHEMRLFSSTNLQISLVNSTLHNENQPAEYKIKVGVKLGSNTMEYFQSGVVITANEESQYFYSSSEDEVGFNEDGRAQYRGVATVSAVNSATLTVSNTNYFFDNNRLELFIRDGQDFVSIGYIDSIGGSDILLSGVPSVTISTSAPNNTIYIKDTQEPNYINNMYHVACSWNDTAHAIDIFLNGQLVGSGTHTRTDSFTFANENLYLGATGGGSTGASSATTNKQFMGELHEMAITSISKSDFGGLYNLLPSYNETLLYLRFEEVDE